MERNRTVGTTDSDDRGEPPELVLFDLDETLFDDAIGRRAGLAAVRREEPALRRIPLKRLIAAYGEILSSSHREAVDRKVDRGEARRARFRQLGHDAGVDWSERRLGEIATTYRESYVEHQRAIPGAARLLDHLRPRARIGVVTNNRVGEQEEKLQEIGLWDRIDFIVVSEGVGVWKPDPQIFRIALERGGAAADRAVMIGDSWESDVLGAAAAGIRPVWFDRYHRPIPVGPRPVEIVRSYVPFAPALLALVGARR